jgi:hypothetical protein
MRVLYRQGDASPSRALKNERSPLEIAIRQNDSNVVREMLHWKELNLREVLALKDAEGKNIMHM